MNSEDRQSYWMVIEDRANDIMELVFANLYADDLDVKIEQWAEQEATIFVSGNGHEYGMGTNELVDLLTCGPDWGCAINPMEQEYPHFDNMDALLNYLVCKMVTADILCALPDLMEETIRELRIDFETETKRQDRIIGRELEISKNQAHDLRMEWDVLMHQQLGLIKKMSAIVGK